MNDKTCHYCTRKATQTIVWLKSPMGVCERQLPLPHCGCDVRARMKALWPAACPRQGVDYLIEPFPVPPVSVEGDGTVVTMVFRHEDDVSVSLTAAGVVCVKMSKQRARVVCDQVRDASHRAEPTCDDPTDHWHGHCGCK